MIAEQEAAAGRYIYAIVNDEGESAWKTDGGFPWTPEPIGFDGRPVYAIAVGRAAAVVSDVPNRPLRPERRNMVTHYGVLKRLLSQNAILPMGFGTIADSAESILQILQVHQDALLQQLQRVEGKFEMGLRVTWSVPNIFEHFVNTHEQLRELRDRLFRPGSEPSPQEKIELGQLFDRTLNAERVAHTLSVVGALRQACFEIKDNKVRDEREVMNLACLVGRKVQAAFEESVFNAAREFSDAYTFDISGPFPPHNFVDLDLRTAEICKRERDMFLIDNILLAPVNGVMYVFREIQAAAEAEVVKDADTLRTQLSELYGMLESGRISSDQFDAKEKELLDLLDGISQTNEGANDE